MKQGLLTLAFGGVIVAAGVGVITKSPILVDALRISAGAVLVVVGVWAVAYEVWFTLLKKGKV